MSVTCWLVLAAVIGYGIDAIGFGVQPWAALAGGVLATGALALLPRDTEHNTADLIAWVGIVIVLGAILLRLGLPELVPPGRGPDLTHHLLLVDYIEHNQHLVHDRLLDGVMGEMAHYTPASHLLAVMAGRWFGSDGLHTFFPLVVVCAALTAGFIFLIARRHGLSLPFALAATLLLLLPSQYFFGAFAHDAFLAQTVSTLFAVAAWWALVVWDDRPSFAGAAIVSIALLGVFLSWPIWLGPPLLVFAALVVRSDLPMSVRLKHAAIVLVPLLALAIAHALGRWGWLVIVRTSGAVLQPSFDSIGWLMPLLAIAGLVISAADRRRRVTVVFVLVIALQAMTLFAVAKAQGAHTPYMAFKMMYLAIYPLAVLSALAIARIVPATIGRDAIGWLVASALVAGVARPALNAPRPIAVVDSDLNAAGKWLRANGGAACADYLVADAETAYWLHLAVLGNPRSSARMAEVDRYDPRAAMAPWITAGGRSYAIADLNLLPDEVNRRVSTVARYGHAAVITRRDATIKGCD